MKSGQRATARYRQCVSGINEGALIQECSVQNLLGDPWITRQVPCRLRHYCVVVTHADTLHFTLIGERIQPFE